MKKHHWNKAIKIMQTEQWEENSTQKKQLSLQYLWDYYKRSKNYIIRVWEEELEKGRKLFEEIYLENFPKMIKHKFTGSEK